MKKLLIFLVLAISLTLTACVEEIDPQKVDKSVETTGNEESAPKTTTYAIGDTVKAKDVEYTLNGVRESQGNEFIKPDEGKVYYLIDLTIENKGSETYGVSSLMNFKLVDGEGVSYDVAIGADTNGSLDGEVMAGRKMKGELAFEIPKAAKGLELEVKHNIMTSGSIIYKLDR